MVRKHYITGAAGPISSNLSMALRNDSEFVLLLLSLYEYVTILLGM